MVDPIDRQAAINALRKRMDKSAKGEIGSFYNQVIIRDIDLLESLPSAQPEHKKGKWIQNDNGTWSCNQCRSWIPDEQHYYANWCLFCGAKMGGGKDEC